MISLPGREGAEPKRSDTNDGDDPSVERRGMMGKRRRWIGMVGLALAIALIAAACGGGGGVQKGGVFRTAQDDFGFTNAFDPTGEYLASAFSMYDALLRTLVATNHTAGPKGNELHPDLATALPTISSDQLTYTFKLKSGLKFGPPVNRAITSKDIEYAFERINTALLVAQYGQYYFGTIKGMDGKAKSRRRSPGSRRRTTPRSSSTSP